MNSFDITGVDIKRTRVVEIQKLGRILRPKPMSLQDIHDRLLEYLRCGRLVEWTRVKGDVKQAALALLENDDARMIRVDQKDYLAVKYPNRILQFFSMGSRK